VLQVIAESLERGSAASGIASTRENRPREMIRPAQLPRGDEDQEFGILKEFSAPRTRNLHPGFPRSPAGR